MRVPSIPSLQSVSAFTPPPLLRYFPAQQSNWKSQRFFLIRGTVSKRFVGGRGSLSLVECAEWCKLFIFVEDCCLLELSCLLCPGNLPPAVFLEEALVQPFSAAVVYYTASWMLQWLTLAKTVSNKKSLSFQDFAVNHNIFKSNAKNIGLSTDLKNRCEPSSFCTCPEIHSEISKL